MKPIFNKVGQIRMASSYMVARDINILGGEWFDVPERLRGFQDKYVSDSKNNILYLIIWEYIHNHPYFRVVKLDGKNQRAMLSEVIRGCCNKIYLRKDNLYVDVYRFINKILPQDYTEEVSDFPITWEEYKDDYDAIHNELQEKFDRGVI